jgi:hypothetical protein
MKRLILLLLLIGFAAPASAQNWSFQGTLPADTLRRNLASGPIKLAAVHGLATDADGNIWVQEHRTVGTVTPTTDIRIGSLDVPAGTATDVGGLWCIRPDGTQCPFSPLTTISDSDGNPADTLGIFYRSDDGGVSVYERMTGRGLSVSPDGQTIYAAFGNVLYAINASDGSKVGSTEVDYGTTLSGVGADAEGNVYVSAVLDSRAGLIYSADLSREIGQYADNIPAIGRGMTAASDGLTVFAPRFTISRTLMYTRDDLFSDFGDADSVLLGLNAESAVIHPTNGMLYVDSGLPGRVDASNALYGTNYQPYVWYGFDISELSATTPNPAPKDSIVWATDIGPNAFQRAIAFSRDGNTAYLGEFDGLLNLAVYAAPGTSIERREELATAIAVHGNAPNPFSGTTTITFELTQSGPVTLKVYDVLGREVATLVDEVLQASSYDATFDASGMPAGTYLYRLETVGGSDTGTMTVLR